MRKKRRKSPTGIPYSGSNEHSNTYLDNETTIKLIEYDHDHHYLEESKQRKVSSFAEDLEGKIRWLKIVGIDDGDKINDVCSPLRVHPLVIKDILGTSKNAKIDDYDDYLFLIVKRMYYLEGELSIEQISFILFKDKLVSFQEFESDVFDDVEERLRKGGNVRKNLADGLLYFLINGIVEDFFALLEDITLKIDHLEDELLLAPDAEILGKIYTLKRDLIYIRSSLWPMRNVLSKLSKDEFNLIDKKTMYYMRDTSDNVVQVMGLVEIYREICSGMLDTYLSSIGNKTNEVMKVLTIFSTIFIPLTFLAGVYGMNFNHIPELSWQYSYPMFWIISIVTIGFMLRYFKKKDWF